MNAITTLCAMILSLVPHGELHDKIKELDRQIAVQPRAVELRLMRGEFLRLHGEHIKALKDFQVATSLDPEGVVVHLMKGQLFFDMKRHGAAAKELVRFLKAKPKNPIGLRCAAENENAQGHTAAAIQYYQSLLALDAPTRPQDILACARLMRGVGSEGPMRSIKFLDHMIKSKGPLIVLEKEALAIEKSAGQFGAAIARIDRLSKKSKRQDMWSICRAEVFRASGDRTQEVAHWLAAKKQIGALPLHVRKRPATVAQAKMIEQEIARLQLEKRN